MQSRTNHPLSRTVQQGQQQNPSIWLSLLFEQRLWRAIATAATAETNQRERERTAALQTTRSTSLPVLMR